MTTNKTAPAYAIGLDYGTNSVRALVVRTGDGAEIGTAVWAFPTGDAGVILDAREPELARQNPADYLAGAEAAIRGAIADAQASDDAFAPDRVVGIGVDTTGSTPLPLDKNGRALGLLPAFAGNPHALAWLWKDHTATREAEEITARARETHPEYLAKCGGAYSSEWFWSKMWRCARVAPDVAQAAHAWIECADWIPTVLTGTEASPRRGLCAAGHKGMYNAAWGGYPSRDFLADLHPDLGRWRDALGDAPAPVAINEAAGTLSPEWQELLGLPAVPVAVGAIDAHLGAVGSGVGPGALVKVMGTSTCDIMVAPLASGLPDVPGMCGIAPETVLPGFFGLEAGQSAVGDLFGWWASVGTQFVKNGDALNQADLTDRAARLAPGESGLLALDWNNGNRTVLVDQRLTGLLIGQTLQTSPHEIYRALIEATAFGSRVIIERMAEYGVAVEQVIVCGGIGEKNALAMQIYADILNRPIRLSGSAQTCALGSAVAASVVGGAYPDFPAAQTAMTALKPNGFAPTPDAARVYDELFTLYRALHDAFGGVTHSADLGDVMKSLLDIRDRARGV